MPESKGSREISLGLATALVSLKSSQAALGTTVLGHYHPDCQT